MKYMLLVFISMLLGLSTYAQIEGATNPKLKTIKGHVIDSVYRYVLDTPILVENETDNIFTEVHADGHTGFALTIDTTKYYCLHLKETLYFPATYIISGGKILGLKSNNTSIGLRPLNRCSMHMSIIMFDKKSGEMLNRDSAMVEIHNMIKLLVENPQVQLIGIIGHTDSNGSFENNERLSKEWAQKVIDIIVSYGIDSSRLIAIGKGEYELLNHCKNGVKCSDVEHSINNRIDLKILK